MIECSVVDVVVAVVVDVISLILLVVVSFKFIRSLMCCAFELISDVVFCSRLLGCSSAVDFVMPAVVVDSMVTNGVVYDRAVLVGAVVDVKISKDSFGSTEFVWICCCFFRFDFS